MKYSVTQLTKVLPTLSLTRLRNIDITSIEEEKLVQAEINKRVGKVLPTGNVFRGDIPDIKTVEDEVKWQKVVDERARTLMPKMVVEPEPEEIVASGPVPDTDGIMAEGSIEVKAKKGGRPKKLATN